MSVVCVSQGRLCLCVCVCVSLHSVSTIFRHFRLGTDKTCNCISNLRDVNHLIGSDKQICRMGYYFY